MRYPMLSILIKSLFQKPATISPKKPAPPVLNARGHVEIEEGACIFCTLCAKKCPTGAITVNREEKCWKLNPYDCIVCSACVDSCPKKCLTMMPQATGPKINDRHA